MVLEVLDAGAMIARHPHLAGPRSRSGGGEAFASTGRFGVSAAVGGSTTCEEVRAGSLSVHPLPFPLPLTLLYLTPRVRSGTSCEISACRVLYAQ